MKSLLLTIDVGTTAVKFNVYDESTIRFSTSKRVCTVNEENYSTQDPKEILVLIKEVIRTLTKKFPAIDMISLSTAMHTLISKKEDEPDMMYLWSDNRSELVIKAFKQNKERAKLFYQKTGTPIHSMSPFAKLLYFKEESPEWYKEIEKWYDMKSYLVEALTNQYAVDYSVASATGLFNSKTLQWDEEILAYLSLKPSHLPKAIQPKTKLMISPSVCQELGLKPKTTLMIGASDGCLVSLASFNHTKATRSLTIGTSGAVRINSKNRQLSDKENLFCYYLDGDHWVIGGPTNNGGVVLEWLSQLFFDNKEQLFDSLTHLKKTDHLLFYPYLQGERAPFWDNNQTGSFTGLTISHGRQEIIQAVLEGVMFNLKLIFEQLPAPTSNEFLVLSGGIFKSQELAQMMATILNQRCVVNNQSEPSQGLKDWWQKSEPSEAQLVYFSPNQEELTYYESKYAAFKKGLRSV